MNKLAALSESVLTVTEGAEACPQCGSIARVGRGSCVRCLLNAGVGDTGESSGEVFENILAEANVPDEKWRLGNYEILGEIGRGGMGIIYRARQRHSRRIVAVKRILSFYSDSSERLQRFRREAEAAASLDHPNILPIYEVSESEEGYPFFQHEMGDRRQLARGRAVTAREAA
jgi:serine/threonine-protein kinase